MAMMSREERRRLAAIERQMLNDDPAFAHALHALVAVHGVSPATDDGRRGRDATRTRRAGRPDGQFHRARRDRGGAVAGRGMDVPVDPALDRLRRVPTCAARTQVDWVRAAGFALRRGGRSTSGRSCF